MQSVRIRRAYYALESIQQVVELRLLLDSLVSLDSQSYVGSRTGP